jgi:rhamnogalacturonyl hydrolase YesR
MNFLSSFKNLKSYCESENFEGWDPYDGLNSKVFQNLPFKHFFIFRLIWIQLFKRSPFNMRKFFIVPKGSNPKGLALFLTGYCNLYNIQKNKEYLDKIYELANKLIELKSENYDHACWGYNFDWQSRAFFLTKNTPTVVATSFCADALMNAYEITKDRKFLDIALDSANFVVNDLKRTKTSDGFIFSYSPFDNTIVYNASLLGSRLLSRSYFYTKKIEYKNLARQSVQSVVDQQNEDGSWVYGAYKIQNWIDSFHTGYNLECIYEYQKFSGDNDFDQNIDKGLDFYTKNFFLDDGTPKYYSNSTYPIDIHCPAQFAVTISRINQMNKYKNLVDKTFQWTIQNMQDKSGFFYFQKNKKFVSKIPYMRWSQAWIFYAMTFYMKSINYEL